MCSLPSGVPGVLYFLLHFVRCFCCWPGWLRFNCRSFHLRKKLQIPHIFWLLEELGKGNADKTGKHNKPGKEELLYNCRNHLILIKNILPFLIDNNPIHNYINQIPSFLTSSHFYKTKVFHSSARVHLLLIFYRS